MHVRLPRFASLAALVLFYVALLAVGALVPERTICRHAGIERVPIAARVLLVRRVECESGAPVVLHTERVLPAGDEAAIADAEHALGFVYPVGMSFVAERSGEAAALARTVLVLCVWLMLVLCAWELTSALWSDCGCERESSCVCACTSDSPQ